MAKQLKLAIQLPYVTQSGFPVYNSIWVYNIPCSGRIPAKCPLSAAQPRFRSLAVFAINKQAGLFSLSYGGRGARSFPNSQTHLRHKEVHPMKLRGMARGN